ncbi:MAG: helix-turn-helix domain-containing protein [Hamadaea sp.]|nr:helix-turn-helix domain-containing protein [Hamadaea sp.]
MDQGEEARRLRREEHLTIEQIRQRLGVGRDRVQDWLRDIPAPDWTRRPNAKDDLHARAIDLRNAGHSVPGIAEELGVSRSTAYQWTKHIPLVQDTAEAERRKRHSKMMTDARWERHRLDRDEQRHRMAVESAGMVGALGERDLLLLGSVIYWCEGSKSKPWRRAEQVHFVNSDVRLIRLFLRFVEAAGHCREELGYRVAIHETADHEAAVRWWAGQIGIDPASFMPTSLKHHDPKTNRRNQGEGYHGCLNILVRKSGDLYRRIESVIEVLEGPAG